MIDQEEKEVSEFFDECAQKGIMDSFDPDEKNKLREFLEQWNIKPGQRILEPGCGSGRLTEYLAKAVGTEGELYACDLSEEMIKKAKQRNLTDHVTVYCGSVNVVPTVDNYFDKVICFQVFPHFCDRVLSLNEIARVLKTGGDLWINHLLSKNAINELHHNASRVVTSHQIPSSDEMLRILTRNGFNVKGIRDSSKGYHAHAVKA